MRRPEPPRAKVGEPARGIDDRRRAVAQELAHRDRERVHRVIARGEIGLERGGAPVGHVDPDARGHDPRGAALGVERDEGTAEPAGDLPRQLERARGNREVEVGLAEAGRAREPGVAHRAADEDGRAPARRGGEDRAQRRLLRAAQPVEAQRGHGRVPLPIATI